MAEEFCRALLQNSNIVSSSDTADQDCIICLQETGKMSSETGLVEMKVRLPCEHVVGSGCIAVWLRTNNSCPLCRRVFFRAHQEQYVEETNVQDQEEEDQDEEDRWEDQEEEEETENMLLTNCRIYSIQLRLDSTTIRIAQAIITIALRIYPFNDSIGAFYDRNAIRLVGMAIYIASSFTGHPRSPREICGVKEANGSHIVDEYYVSGEEIRDDYRLIYGQRERLINDVIMESLDGRDRVWPSVDPEYESDDYIEISRDLPAVRAHCVNECAQLQAPPSTVDLAQHIAANVVRAGFHAFSHPEDSEHLSGSQITAVSIYIASHLLGQPLSRRSLQRRIENHCPDIRSTCIVVRDKCDRLVRDEFCWTRGFQVSWESLEADIGKESPDGRHENQDDEDVTPREATSTATRSQQLMSLCDTYCIRLEVAFQRTNILAQRLSERFGSFKTFDGRRLESIAAACVYIACFCTNYHYRYADLIVMTGVSLNSMYTTHLMMAQEIVLERVNVQDIAESLDVGPRRIRNTLLPIDF